jgi:hypothetical protein
MVKFGRAGTMDVLGRLAVVGGKSAAIGTGLEIMALETLFFRSVLLRFAGVGARAGMGSGTKGFESSSLIRSQTSSSPSPLRPLVSFSPARSADPVKSLI